MQIHTKRLNSTQGWREIAGRRIFFRSSWEYKFAVYLQVLKNKKKIADWAHEPETFWFEGIRRGCTSYKPDFRIDNFDGSREWLEVKGYYDAKSLTKIKRFRKYFPTEKLRLIDAKWFKANSKKLAILKQN